MCNRVKANRPLACKDDRRTRLGSPLDSSLHDLNKTHLLFVGTASKLFSEVQTGRNTDGGFLGSHAWHQGAVPAPRRQQTRAGLSGFPYEVKAQVGCRNLPVTSTWCLSLSLAPSGFSRAKSKPPTAAREERSPCRPGVGSMGRCASTDRKYF